MPEVGIWNVTGNVPVRYQRGKVELEQQLEAWIEADPSLIEPGLHIVGRQVPFESGSLDLLGIDPSGRWAVIEIHKGNVRRETLMQAVDAAARISIDELPPDDLAAIVAHYLAEQGTTLEAFFERTQRDAHIFEERDLTIYVVGTGRDQDYAGMAKFLKGSEMSIQVINFDVFENSAGERLLVRRLTAIDTELPLLTKKSAVRPRNIQIDRLIALANENGIGEPFQRLHDTALEHGLYPRTYRWSIMYAPPTNRTRVLLCSWANPKKGELELYISARQFAEFYPISEDEAVKLLGDNRYERFTPKTLVPFLKAVDKVFKQIAKNS